MRIMYDYEVGGRELSWDASLYRLVLMCSRCGHIMDFQGDWPYSEPVPIGENADGCPRCSADLEKYEPRWVTLWPKIPPVEEAIAKGEGQTIEFKSWSHPIGSKSPKMNDLKTKLTKYIAGFATSNAGLLYLGVGKDLSIEGVQVAYTPDEFGLLVNNIARDRVKPSVAGIDVEFQRPVSLTSDEDRFVIAIAIPKGLLAPVYHADGEPYMRDGRRTRRMRDEEVKQYEQTAIKRRALDL